MSSESSGTVSWTGSARSLTTSSLPACTSVKLTVAPATSRLSLEPVPCKSDVDVHITASIGTDALTPGMSLAASGTDAIAMAVPLDVATNGAAETFSAVRDDTERVNVSVTICTSGASGSCCAARTVPMSDIWVLSSDATGTAS